MEMIDIDSMALFELDIPGAPPRCGKYCGTKEIECNKKLFNQTYIKETGTAVHGSTATTTELSVL